MSYVNAVIIEGLVPNIDHVKAIVISDGENILMQFKDKADLKVTGIVSEIQLHRDDVERLLELINDPA